MVERVIYKQKTTGTKNRGASSLVSSNIWMAHATSSGLKTPLLDNLVYQIWCRTVGVEKSITFDSRYEVTISQASNVLRIGLYTIHPLTFLPHELIVDGGTASNASTGEKTISLTVTNLPVHFYVAMVSQGGVAATMRTASGVQGWIHTFYGRNITVSSATSFGGFHEAGVSGALPSVATPVQSVVTSTDPFAITLGIP